MPTAQSFNTTLEKVQPYSPIDAVDLRQSVAGISESGRSCLVDFLDNIVHSDVLKVHLTADNGSLRCQISQLSGVEEFRDDQSNLLDALAQLCSLAKGSSPAAEFGGLTLHITTEHRTVDLHCINLSSIGSDNWVLRAREINPVPVVLDTIGLEHDELRHLRRALTERRGLISIGTPHRRHQEDWHRAICREVCSPELSVVSLAPRILEALPRISQTVLPPGEHWDKRFWQLASHSEADVIVLSDDGTHGYAPDQLGVLAERCLVVQILQTPDIGALAHRTPTGANVHRVLMHLPVRRLCSKCSEPHSNPCRTEYGFLDRVVPTLSDGVSAWLSASQSMRFKKACGCKDCASLGYHGELCVTDSISEPALLKNPAELIDEQVLSASRTTKLVGLASAGDVCLNEVRRVLASRL